MKFLDWLLLAVVVYIIIRLTNERAKTDFQVKHLQASIPDVKAITPITVVQLPPATTGPITPDDYTPVDYAENYEQAKS